jgi:uncharacterized spore protein YtfJ
MSSEEPIQPIAELIERSLSIRHVYGEAVTQGEVTVIPVAKVTYGFGAGGGGIFPHRRTGPEGTEGSSGDERTSLRQGSGGGGGVIMSPVGVVEMTPQGTRFLSFRPWERLLGAAALGLVAGWLLGRRRR